MARLPKEIDIELLQKLLNQGLGISQIAERMGHGRGAISRKIKKLKEEDSD